MTWKNRIEQNNGKIPIIYLKGSHFEIGKLVGQSFKQSIHEALLRHTTFGPKLLPFYETSKGKNAYDQLLSASKRHLPRYVEEIDGIATGAEVEFYKLFLLHIEADLDPLISAEKHQSSSTNGEGCSDFMVLNETSAIHTHSEDSDPAIKDLGCVWVADIEASNGTEAESFVAFCYPGMIPGSAWTVNSHGLIYGGNIISQSQSFTSGMIPRRLLCRAVLNEKSVEELPSRIELLTPMASAFNLMLSQAKESSGVSVQMASLEIFGEEKGNKTDKETISNFLYHFNEFQRIKAAFSIDASSKAREKRLDEFIEIFHGPPSNMDHIKTMMSDDTNKDYPIFRQGAPPDYLATASIMIADHNAKQVFIYKAKPAETDPSITINLQGI